MLVVGRALLSESMQPISKLKRRALGKVSSLTIERDQHEIDRIVKFLGDVRVVDLDCTAYRESILCAWQSKTTHRLTRFIRCI